MSEEKKLEFGQWVRHAKYGIGIFLGIKPYPSDSPISVAFKRKTYDWSPYHGTLDELTPTPSPNQLSDAEKVREVIELLCADRVGVSRGSMLVECLDYYATVFANLAAPKPTLLEAAKAITEYYSEYGPTMPNELREPLREAIAREEAKNNA